MTRHRPVLRDEAVALLAPAAGGFYVDATVGGGGHAAAVLEASAPDGRLLGLDRDAGALERAAATLAPYGERVTLVHARASELRRVLEERGFPAPLGVLLDFGLSSDQLDEPGRGFSFRQDGPLDMRMDREQELDADEVVNRWPEERLVALFREGEEPRARRLARAIVEARPLHGTRELARVVESVVGRGPGGSRRVQRAFQAIRLAVNDELSEVSAAVEAALDAVAVEGRVVALAFHSLEDRIVKRLFRRAAGVDAPRDAYGNPVREPRFALLSRRAVKATGRDDNPRARSARLRAVRRLRPGDWRPGGRAAPP